MLDPVNGREYLKGIDNNGILEFAGLMTLRFLRLAFASPLEVFETLHNKIDVRERLKADALYRVTLKTETLSDDLKKLVTGEYSRLFRRPARAEKALDQDRRKNVSTNPGIDLTTLSRGIVSRVQEREWLYFDELGYPPYAS